MSRRTWAGCTTAALAVSVAGAVLAANAEAAPAAPMSYTAGASGTRFAGLAFDTCDAPTKAQMQAWRSSPYGAVGIYISGDQRACEQRALTREWVRQVSAMGWKLLPLDVGLQAPCADNLRLRPMSTDPAKASAQGAAAAVGSIRAAALLGILPGSALYSDVESYDANDSRCARAVRAYWSGWTQALHARGYLAGAYGNLESAVQDLAESHASTSYARPDVVWNAQWNNSATLRGWAQVPDAYWPLHQRVKQFRGDGNETYGGVTLYTDRNVVDAPVATVAQSYQVAGRGDVPARDRPVLAASVARAFAGGSVVGVVCRAATSTGVWAKLTDGTYLPESAVGAGPSKSVLPTCTIPHQVTAPELHTRAGPSKATPITGTLPNGSLAWVTCETPGITLGRAGFWHRLEGGSWVSGAFVATRSPGARTEPIPLCPPAAGGP